MAEEVVLMKGNEAIALRLPYYPPIRGIGNTRRTETVGNHRYGSASGRE